MTVGQRGEDAVGLDRQGRDDSGVRQKAEQHAATLALGVFEVKELSAVLAFEKFHGPPRSIGPAPQRFFV